MCVCVLSTIVVHLWASLQELRMCHINHIPVNKSGELGSNCVCTCVCPYICRQVVMFVHKVEYRKVLSSEAHIYIVSSFSIWKLLSPHSDYSWLQIVRVLSGFSCSVRGVEHDVRWSVRGELTMTDSSCHQLPHREGTSISERRPTNTLVNSLKFTQCTQARRREVRCMQTTAPDRDFCAFANKIVYRILY